MRPHFTGVGHTLFSIAAAGLAIATLRYGDFAPAWRAIPAAIPGREFGVYISAALLLAASVGLCLSRTAPPSALALGAYLVLWAAASTPPIAAAPLQASAWYGLCEAASSLAGAGTLYALLRGRSRDATLPLAGQFAVRGAQGVFGVTCLYYGWSHFAFSDYTASMVPAWLPDRVAFARFTGIGHVAAGLGLTLGVLPRLAAVLEALMMSSFGLLVWIPSLWTEPRPAWAGTPQNQCSELLITLLLAAAAWVIANALRKASLAGAAGI